MTALLLGRKGIDLDEVRAALVTDDVELLAGTGIDDVREAFDAHDVDAVIMGAGIDLEDRLAIVREVFERSETCTVHMKDRASGPSGMTPFVAAVLGALGGVS